MNPIHKQTLFWALEQWLQEAIRRCDYLLAANPADAAFNQRRIFEEHYVLTSAMMCRRYAIKLKDHSGAKARQVMTAFLEETQAVDDVRDMREHSDAYFMGKGIRQESYLKVENNIACDASSAIVIQGEGYKLGNRVTVEHVKEACEVLLNQPTLFDVTKN